MYHVTNVCSKDHEGKVVNANHPDWDVIQRNVADDEHYDGELVGLPVVCFTTTKYNGGPPNYSPYPRLQQDGKPVPKNTKHWRVSVPFNPNRYKIFKMAQCGKQRHLLCLDDTQDGTDSERALVDILSMLGLKLSSEDHNQYFPSGRANDYANARFFVNVCFITPIPIKGENIDAKWDDVCRNDLKYGNIVEIFNGKPHDLCLKEWGDRRLEYLRSCLLKLEEKWEGIFVHQGNLEDSRRCNPENNNHGPENNDLGPDNYVSRMAKMKLGTD